MNQRKELTVIIPYFNDFESALEMFNFLSTHQYEPLVSFLILDNGSEESKLKDLVSEANLRNVSFLRTESNLGFGGGIMFGIANVSTSHVAWMPGNLKVKPSDAINLWHEWLDNPEFDAVKAKRRRSSRLEALKTLAAGSLASVVYRKNLLDSGGTPTLAETGFMSGLLATAPKDYDFELFIMFAMRVSKFKIMRPKVVYGSRKYGHSHWQTSLSAELRLLWKLLSQQKRMTALVRNRD
jgi:hypothetical protein